VVRVGLGLLRVWHFSSSARLATVASQRQVTGNPFTKYYRSTTQIPFDIWLIPCYPFESLVFASPRLDCHVPSRPPRPNRFRISDKDIRPALPRSARGQSIARRDPAVLIHSCAEKFSGQLPRNQ